MHIQPDTHMPIQPNPGEYLALFHQTGTNAPDPQVFKNTLRNQTNTWIRASQGAYTMELNHPTPRNKIWFLNGTDWKDANTTTIPIVDYSTAVIGYLTLSLAQLGSDHSKIQKIEIDTTDTTFTNVEWSTIMGGTYYPIQILIFN